MVTPRACVCGLFARAQSLRLFSGFRGALELVRVLDWVGFRGAPGLVRVLDRVGFRVLGSAVQQKPR